MDSLFFVTVACLWTSSWGCEVMLASECKCGCVCVCVPYIQHTERPLIRTCACECVCCVLHCSPYISPVATTVGHYGLTCRNLLHSNGEPAALITCAQHRLGSLSTCTSPRPCGTPEESACVVREWPFVCDFSL